MMILIFSDVVRHIDLYLGMPIEQPLSICKFWAELRNLHIDFPYWNERQINLSPKVALILA